MPTGTSRCCCPSVNPQNEVVQVHILAREAKQLAYLKADVQRCKGDDVRPSLITPDGLPVYKPMDLLRGKRGQDFLLLLQLRNFNVLLAPLEEGIKIRR
jgi:hypothetical protein